MRPFRLLAVALSLGLVMPATACAAEAAGLSAAFGNTVKALYPDGRSQWLWIRADGSWEAFGRRGRWSSGHWTQKAGQQLCLRQSKPVPIPLSYCTSFPAGSGVGAVWSSKSMEGDPIRVTVVKGIQRPPAASLAATH